MPTTITPAVETVVNTGSQNLFTISTVTTIPAVQPANVQITGSNGTFSSDGFNCYNVGDTITISGTPGGNVIITGYTDPTTYYIINTNGGTTFQLSATAGGANIVTASGPTTGLSFAASGTAFPAKAGAVQYNTTTTPQTVTYSAVTANVGTAITSNVTTGVFSLTANVANIAYQLNGFVTVTATPAVYGWVNTATGAAIGPTATAGTPLSTTYVKSTANTVTVGLRVSTVDGGPFAYPTQIQAAAATVSELSGYTVA
jgi:hypothetical protein